MNSSNMAKEGYRMGQISERMARVKGFSGKCFLWCSNSPLPIFIGALEF